MASTSPQDRGARAREEIDRMFSRLATIDHFTLLGVERDASPQDVRAHYLALAKKWHVDAFAGLDIGGRQEQLELIFKRIAEAHEVLTTPIARAEYMTLLERRRAGLSTDVDAILRAEACIDEGLAELARKRWPEALRAFDEASRLNPDDPLIWAHRAWAMYRAADKTPASAKAAQAALDRAIKSQANLPEAYRYQGSIAFEQDELDRAVRWLERCLEWAPRDVEATRLLRLARARREKQKPEGWVGRLSAIVSKWLGSR